jgi:hypothetical protein
MVVSPFWRMTISINDDPDKMRVLFFLTPDMKDKVNLFLVSDGPLPMPTTTLDERSEFRRVIGGQLAAYAWWLLNVFEIPAALRSVRFGVKEWHHPALSMELFEDTPAAELLQIIDSAEFKQIDIGADMKLWDVASDSKEPGTKWEGSAIGLEKLLTGEDPHITCTLAREAKKLFMHNKVERLLGRLREDQAERVAHHRTRAERRWVVVRSIV